MGDEDKKAYDSTDAEGTKPRSSTEYSNMPLAQFLEEIRLLLKTPEMRSTQFSLDENGVVYDYRNNLGGPTTLGNELLGAPVGSQEAAELKELFLTSIGRLLPYEQYLPKRVSTYATKHSAFSLDLEMVTRRLMEPPLAQAVNAKVLEALRIRDLTNNQPTEEQLGTMVHLLNEALGLLIPPEKPLEMIAPIRTKTREKIRRKKM